MRLSRGAAWADWLFFGPLFIAGSIGMLLGHAWGYVLFGAAGACSLYINIILWVTEKEYVYPTRAAALGYSALRLSGIAV